MAVSQVNQSASVYAFHVAIGISAVLVALGGQLAGQPLDTGHPQAPELLPQPITTAKAETAVN